MGKAVKRSVSFPPEIDGALEREAEAMGESVSAFVTEAVRRALRVQAGLRACAEWEAEHGPVPPDITAWAEQALDRALAEAE
jgi:predicted transcriptional regulator